MKKEQDNTICSDIDEPRTCHAEWSNSERKRQISHNTIDMWTLERQLRLPYLQTTESQLRKQLMVPKRGMKGGMNWETGIDIYIYTTIYKTEN